MSIEQDIFDFNEPSEVAVLRALLDSGTISLDDVATAMNKKKKEYVIKKHKYTIYLDSQGRWRTYFKESGMPSAKRKLISKRTEDEIYNTLYDLYSHKEERVRRGLVTIEDLYEDWIEHKRLHGISEATILKYQSDWRCHMEGNRFNLRMLFYK